MAHVDTLAAAADNLVRDAMSVVAGEEMLITADTATDPAVAAAILAAGQARGAIAALMTVPRFPFQGALADPFVPATLASAARASAVWIDLTFPYLAGSHLQDTVMQAKTTRYLLLGDTGRDPFVRLYGLADLDRYHDAQRAFDAVFDAARGETCRIANGRGSDVRFKLTASTLNKPRRATGPGMYLVPGTCSIAPDIATVEGTIVVDAVFHEFYERLADPIRVEVAGEIRDVAGGGGSGLLFERALRRAARNGMGSIIHFSHGLHPAARYTGASFIEDIRAVGNNAVGFGTPWWEPGGGENHPDGVMTAHSVWIGDRQVIDAGRIVWPAPLAEKAAALAPVRPPQTAATR